ncbi:MAG TPA: HDOD domain-containing protein [Gallionellaceae bacterium]|nr:HDOD domain-containing protein [Gallionellaceae bacterium]
MTISKEEVLARLHQLPSVPMVIQKLMDSFKDEDMDANALANMIARDQGLSARVLRVANSPFYGLPRKIASIQDAVLVMGFSGVRSLVLSAGIVHAFPEVPGSRFDRSAYWKRSFRVAAYARALAQSLRQDAQMAFTAAMFHEIGLLVLDVCIPEQFSLMLQDQALTSRSLMEIEQAQMGFDHALIGAEVARSWNFPDEIEHAIRYWAMPDHEPFRAVTGIVYVAVQLENGLRGEDLIRRLPEALCRQLGLSWDHIEAGLPDEQELNAGAGLMLAA